MKDNLKDLIFLKAFGGSPRNRVLMFLIENNIFDYSKSDIAKYCSISRVTLDSFFANLIKLGIIKKTRTVGRAVLYKINFSSPIVQQLVQLNELVTNKYADLLLEKEKIYV